MHRRGEVLFGKGYASSGQASKKYYHLTSLNEGMSMTYGHIYVWILDFEEWRGKMNTGKHNWNKCIRKY